MDSQLFDMIINMLGGLGLFLFGMHIMGNGLEVAAGTKLRGMIEKLTKNKYMGALVGFVVTAIIQSSSATTVMVVGFVNSGIMTLTQAVGVIMGANIGTTVTGLIISINLTTLAPIIVFVGAILLLFIKNSSAKHIGQIILGFGIIFMGLDIMSSSMQPLSTFPQVTNIISNLSNPFTGLLVGLIFTAIIQSSSASVGVLQALGSAGVVSLSNTIFVIYGQNIGTCVTALISAAGASKAAKRTAVVHLIFNVFGALFFTVLTIFLPIAQWIENLFPSNVMFQISFVHIIFNVVCVAIMLPLSDVLIKIACKIIPESEEEKCKGDFLYIDERVLNTPPMAVSLALKEIERMGIIASDNFNMSMNSFLKLNKKDIEKIEKNEKMLDKLNMGIVDYLTKLNALDIPDKDVIRLTNLYHCVSDIERIGDHSENICELTEGMLKNNKKLHNEEKQDIYLLYTDVKSILDKTLIMLKNRNVNISELDNIYNIEKEIDKKTLLLKDRVVDRLRHGESSAVVATILMDLYTNLERIADHTNNICNNVKRCM